MFDKLGEDHLTITNVAEQLEGTDKEWQARDNFFDRIGFLQTLMEACRPGTISMVQQIR